jgi:hypothetical protein
VGREPMGWGQADWLMQLAVNLASPAVLVGIKRQLVHFRSQQTATPPLEAPACHVANIFEAGLRHNGNEQAAKIGSSLASCYIYDRHQARRTEQCPDASGQVAMDIMSKLSPGTYTYTQILEYVKKWTKRAWAWKQLERIVGSPNILCFLPHDVTYFPGEPEVFFTHYRDLKKGQFDALESILRTCRPGLLQSVPKDFFQIFLFGTLPERQFRIEEWTDEEILQEPLDSAKFNDAFEHVV